MQVLNETNNKLVGRKEIRARITYQGATPNRKDLLKEFKSKNVIIRSIRPEFGNNSAIVEAVEYSSKEVMDKIEAEHLKKKHVFEEEKPAEVKEEEKNE